MEDLKCHRYTGGRERGRVPRENLIEKVIFKEKYKGNGRVRRITDYSKH